MTMKRSDTNTASGLWRLAFVAAAILLPLLVTGCGKKGQAGEKKTVQKSEDDFLDKDAKPDEGKYLLAAKPLSLSPIENTPTLTRYSPATREHGCPSISLSLLSRTLILSKANRICSTM
jgi:hypothetical protein